MKTNKNLLQKGLVFISYLGMVFVNYLANALPINGIGTGELSDMYPNLFTPAGITFSIWGIIYLLLGLFVIYQFKDTNEKLLEKLRIYFILTSIINISWIFAWHYQVVWLSLLIMIAFLVLLIKTLDLFKKEKLPLMENIILKLPFSVYFGWISVATIANFTVFFVNINWGGFGLSDQFWVIVVLLVGVLIGSLRAFHDRNIAYMTVFIWAYLGILIKHTSQAGFAGEYPLVIYTLYLSIAIFVLNIAFLLSGRNFSYFCKKK